MRWLVPKSFLLLGSPDESEPQLDLGKPLSHLGHGLVDEAARLLEVLAHGSLQERWATIKAVKDERLRQVWQICSKAAARLVLRVVSTHRDVQQDEVIDVLGLLESRSNLRCSEDGVRQG